MKPWGLTRQIFIKRHLHLLEWQGKSLLMDYGIPVQRFQCISQNNIDEIDNIKYQTTIVKAQCEAGGRGKGRFIDSKLRGVEVLREGDRKLVKAIVSGMLQDKLVTAQTGPEGTYIETVMVAEGIDDLGKQRYLAIMLDRSTRSPILMVSPHGGVDIEEHENEILKIPINGSSIDYSKISETLGIPINETRPLVDKLLLAFEKSDAILIEINPLSISESNGIVAIDAKITIDDNASFRQSQFTFKHSNYVKLEGEDKWVGCMVNGAGLAMATMDLLQGAAANFLDIGGSATHASVGNALRQLSEDERLRCILINVFGGIVRCDEVALGIREALTRDGNKKLRGKAIVVRLAGTNAQLGLNILKGLPGIHPCLDLSKAAEMALQCGQMPLLNV